MANYDFDDFTEQGYCAALDLARAHWAFEPYGTESTAPHVLWRHDVDVSPHRALRLAQFEAERGLRATYFFLLHGIFYNCLEPSIRDIIRAIAGHGHDIGLHFDAGFYSGIADRESLEHRVAHEAAIIGDLAQRELRVVSFHDPTAEQLARFGQPRIAGLINTYGKPISEGYRYVSDSNGYWRFHRLLDVLTERKDRTLHVLTHPEWWTPDAASPRDRIARAVQGRATSVLSYYDMRLNALGRTNVR